MLMAPMLVKAPVVTYTEIAKSPQWHNGNGMFDGTFGLNTSSLGAMGDVIVNAKYTGWLIVGIRYTRDNYNNNVKADGIRTIRLQMLEGGVWKHVGDYTFPYGEYMSQLSLLESPITISPDRRFRASALSNYASGNGAQWKEIEFVVGYP